MKEKSWARFAALVTVTSQKRLTFWRKRIQLSHKTVLSTILMSAWGPKPNKEGMCMTNPAGPEDVIEHRPAEEMFRLIVEAAPIGMVVVNREGTILMVNAHMEKLFGYSRAQLVNQPIETLIPERFRGKH